MAAVICSTRWGSATEHLERFLPAGMARAQHVQAHPGGDRGQPRAEVRHVRRARPVQPEPGVLHRVVGILQRAEHPVGHGAQVSSMLLEAFRRPLVLVHRSHPRVAKGQYK
jgi:hypothetical protein